MTIGAAPPIAQGVPLRERALHFVLFVAVLASSVAFIEPSPHDALMGVLAVAALIAGVRFDRTLAIPVLLLLLWNVAGLMALLNIPADRLAIQYAVTSLYLAIATIVFACIFAQATMPRIATMRAAYILTALIATLAGIAGYFNLFPGAAALFSLNGRAMGAFKDPNVFGPFLILPVMMLLDRMLAERIRLRDLAVVSILLIGLLLSFSRGAWFHLVASGAVLISLRFLVAPNPRKRMRVFALGVLGVTTLAASVVIALSIDAIAGMFWERAQIVQYYDVGEGGRFRLQQLALNAMLDFPNGMGPFEFAREYGLQQHNVYLQAFLVYGWAGGIAYILLLLATLAIGVRAALIPAPWQTYLIAAYATFVGVIAEGMVIDTDHWRHFYLVLGTIWGLSAASIRHRRSAGILAPIFNR